MICFRTDANNIIATGHMMRSITIAKHCKKCGEKVVFLISNEESIALLELNHLDYFILNTKWENLDAIKEMQCLRENKINTQVIVIDLPTCTRSYVYELKKHYKIVCIDDLAKEVYPVNILINYNIFYEKLGYEAMYETQETDLLLGTQYMPLREQFSLPGKKIKREKNIHHILVMCGGGDKYNFLFNFLETLITEFPIMQQEYEWNVVSGKYNENYHELKKIEEEHPNIHVYSNVENIAEMMLKCDLAISAASTVLYECCSMKLPTLFFVVADDQIYDADAFSKEGMMKYCGDYRNESHEVLKRIIQEIKTLEANPGAMGDMIKMMERCVDGKGTERIVSKILMLCVQ